MQVEIYWVDSASPGRLGIMPRPRGGDWLEDEVVSLRRSGADVVVSLLEREEIEELEIEKEASFCEAHGLTYITFPIPDRDVPSSERDTLRLIRSLASHLREGRSVVVHCRQGVGRSALVAASVLVLGGLPVDEAFTNVENARGCQVPDTPEQRAWVARFALNFSEPE